MNDIFSRINCLRLTSAEQKTADELFAAFKDHADGKAITDVALRSLQGINLKLASEVIDRAWTDVSVRISEFVFRDEWYSIKRTEYAKISQFFHQRSPEKVDFLLRIRNGIEFNSYGNCHLVDALIQNKHKYTPEERLALCIELCNESSSTLI